MKTKYTVTFFVEGILYRVTVPATCAEHAIHRAALHNSNGYGFRVE